MTRSGKPPARASNAGSGMTGGANAGYPPSCGGAAGQSGGVPRAGEAAAASAENLLDLAQLRPGDRRHGLALIRDCARLANNRGEPYWRLLLANQTGTITAFMFNDASGRVERHDRWFEPGRILFWHGKVNLYQGRLQLVVDAASPSDPSCIDPAAFYRPRVFSEVEARRLLDRYCGSMANSHLGALLQKIFAVHGGDFCRWPAGRSLHHAWPGGLADHTLSVAALADAVAPRYPHLDRDVLTAGALLHDLGKLRELSGGVPCEYTDEGRLLGHVALGVLLLAAHIDTVSGFPSRLRSELLHLVASHHGELRFGSPVVPQTLEAIVLHRLDDLDARGSATDELVGQLRTDGIDWSPEQRLQGCAIFRGGQAAPTAPAPVSPAHSADERSHL